MQLCGVKGSCGQANSIHAYSHDCRHTTSIECREQSVPRPDEGKVAPRDKRAAQLLAHSSLGEGLTQRNLRPTILPGCSPQLDGSLLVSMPLLVSRVEIISF